MFLVLTRDSHRHVPAQLLPHGVDLADVLGHGRHDPRQVVAVVHHRARDGPVRPGPVGRSEALHPVRLHILPAVGLVQQRARQRPQVELVRREAELLARAGLHHLRRDGRRALGCHHLGHDLLGGRRGLQADVASYAAEPLFRIRPKPVHGPQDAPEPVRVLALELVEERGPLVVLEGLARDGADFEVRVAFRVDLDDVPIVFERLDVGPKAQVGGWLLVGSGC